MRLRSLATVLGGTLLLLVTAGPSSFAEGDSALMRDPTLDRGRGFLHFFRRPQPERVEPRRQRVAPAQPRRERPVVVRDDPVSPKVDVVHHVAVVGDSLADLVAVGLEEALNDRPDTAVLKRTRPDSGLVRSDFHDWPKAVAALLTGEPKPTLAVVMLGLNDRQALREGDAVHEPLSERWLQLYRSRIDQIATAFAEQKVPLIWIGLPPMQNGRLSSDLGVLNDLYRERAERSGGQYVDLWGAYLDADNRYSAMGPDVTGQTVRLRLNDGIHFTRAGARKAAHFVDVLLRRRIEARPGEPVLAIPSATGDETAAPAPAQSRDIERLIDQMVAGLPELSGLSPTLIARPLAGPIQPLTGAGPGLAENGLLMSVRDIRGGADAAEQLDRVFGRGQLPEPRGGRLDDYRWPRRAD